MELLPTRIKTAWRVLTTGTMPQVHKTYSSGLSSMFSLVGRDFNQDLAADEYGAAQAYAVMTGVQRGVAFWQKQLGGLTGYLYDGKTSKIIASTADRKLPIGPGAMFMRALKRFPQDTKHGFFESIAFSDWLYGETYIVRLANNAAHSDFQWANPLAIEPYISGGEIRGYRYQSGDGYELLQPEQVAFRIAHRNPFDDLRGQSPILSAMDEINVSRNVVRALRGYYSNGMILGGIISPEDKMDVTGTSIEDIRKEMGGRNRGVANAFNWFFTTARVKVDQFETIDIEKNYGIVAPLTKRIMMSLGVPPVLAGDPTEVNYDNIDKAMLNWWKAEGIPYAKSIANDFINGQLLPAIEPNTDIYFGFDLSAFEVQDPAIITADIDAGYISIALAQEKRGYKADETLRDIYMISGRPMHKDVIVQVANQSPELATDTGNEASTGIPADVSSQMVGLAIPGTSEQPIEDAKHNPIAHAIEESKTWDGGWTPGKARKELGIWQRKFKSGNGQTFTPEYTHGDLSDIVINAYATGADIEATFDVAFDMLRDTGTDKLFTAFGTTIHALRAGDSEMAIKSLTSIRRDFEAAFADALATIRSGDITNRRSAGTLIKQLLEVFGEQLFIQGLKDTGIDDAPDEFDRDVINTHLREQSPHVSKLTDVLINKDGISDAEATQKLTMWFNGSVMPLYYDGIESGNKNALFQFTGRIKKTSCQTCIDLWGQRHRYKDWKQAGFRPRVDGNNFDCTGRNCHHRLTPTQGKPRGHLRGVTRPEAA